jgi:hypothetical protein
MCIGLLSAFVVKSRGRFGLKWFLVLVVLGPLGFLTLFLPRKK